jgi:DNA-binding CsgD family transcriptional regulator
MYGLFDSMAAHFFLWNDLLDCPEDSLASRTYLGQKAALDYYLRIDPRRIALGMQSIGTTLLCHEHFSDAFVDRHEFFQDYSLPLGRRYLMATRLVRAGPSTSILALLRGPRQNPFGPAEATLLERLRPHLLRVAQMQRRFAQLRRDAALGNDLLNATQTCMVAVVATAKIIRLNQAGETMLRRGDVMRSTNGHLVASVHAQTTFLHSLIRQATGVEVARGGGSMIMDGMSGTRTGVTVMPLVRGSSVFGLPDVPLALVTTGSLEQTVRPDRPLAEMFGLTETEAKLAAAVGAGKRLDVIAEERNVRMTTLRTQMRSIYSKTGTSRLAELAQMIAKLP